MGQQAEVHTEEAHMQAAMMRQVFATQDRWVAHCKQAKLMPVERDWLAERWVVERWPEADW